MRALAIAILLVATAGCVLRWRDKPLLEVNPDADVWIHHPEQGTNAPAPPRP